MSDIVLVVMSAIVIPDDFALVTQHRPVKMLKRVCVSVRLRIDQKQSREYEYG